MTLEVTEVQVWPLKNPKPGSKLKANCRITYNDSVHLNGKLWNGKNGLFVGADGRFGEKKNEEGGTEQVFYPSWVIKDADFQTKVTQMVIEKYNSVTGNTTQPQSPSNFNQQNVPF